MKNKLASNPLVRLLASDRITVFCIFWLFVLTFWGTIAQVEHGLYPAQERFFNSIVFLVWSFIPFPGARLILWIFFINLVLVAFLRFDYTWRKFGHLVTHCGILLLLLSAFVTFHYSNESHLTFFEGEGMNVASAYHDWELAAWKSKDSAKDVIAYDAKTLKQDKVLRFDEFPFEAVIRAFYANAKAYTSASTAKNILNATGITMLKKEEAFRDPVKNTPGIQLLFKTDSGAPKEMILYGAETEPTAIEVNGETYFLQLRYKHFPLPFIAKLVDFRLEQHPGTEMARSYESTLEIQTPQMTRETIISMNNPFRYKDYTLYQSSYAIDEMGREQSTIAVVRNVGRVLPYIATLVTFLGLLIHFIFMVRNHLANEKT